MPVQSKPIMHTMLESDKQVQREVEERTGTCPCIWQINHSHLGDGECLQLAEVSVVASKVEPVKWNLVCG